MSYEIEFKELQKNIKSFKKELKELMVKYKVGKFESEKYNGMEKYCGTRTYLTINGEVNYKEYLNELIDDCL
jgi:hypothetical protein